MDCIVLGLTHAIAGVLVGTLASIWLGFDVHIMFFAVLGALLPDIDHPSSKLGRYVKPFGWFAKHRGFMHSLFAGVVFAAAIKVLNTSVGMYDTPYAAVFLTGYASHLLLDGWTKEGIQPFYPSKIKVKGKRKVGSLLEWILAFFMTAIIFYAWIILQII